jgi:hypothetical protein
VPKQALDVPQIDALFQQQGCDGVPQHVRCDPPRRDACGVPPDNCPHRLVGYSHSLTVYKQRVLGFGSTRNPVSNVDAQYIAQSVANKRNLSFTTPLAMDENHKPIHVNVPDIGAHHFAHSHSCRKQKFQQNSILIPLCFRPRIERFDFAWRSKK